MAGLNMALRNQLMNGNVNLDITNLAQLSGQQQVRMMEASAATLGFDDNEDETQSKVHDSESSSFGQTRTTLSTFNDLDEGHCHGASQASPEEVPSKEFEKELFLEEIRRYRCLWDTNSEGYKSRPMKQNAWSKLSQLFNKDGECQSINFPFRPSISEKPFSFLLQIML